MITQMNSSLGQVGICVFQGLRAIKHNELLHEGDVWDTDAEQVTKPCMQGLFPDLLLVTLSLSPTPISTKIMLWFCGHREKSLQ